jgi:nucleoside-diphosphate-sugar epimerase
MATIEGMTLVTGGTGFLGGRGIERLAGDGTPVRAWARRPLPEHLRGLAIETWPGDLVDAASLMGALEGVETVIHCAGLVTDFAPFSEFMRVNGQGTANLVEAALAARTRCFVHVSTTDVYGYAATPQLESDPVRHTGLGYNESKILAESVVRNAGAERGLRFSIVRPASIYGPRSETFVVELARLLRERQMMLFGDGSQDAGLVYVDNVVDLILATATDPRALGETYNASDDEGISWQRYCDELAELIGASTCRTHLPYWLGYAIGAVTERTALLLRRRRRPLLTRTAVKLLGIPCSHPSTKARRDLGWEPRVSFADGMRRVGAWLEENPIA